MTTTFSEKCKTLDFPPFGFKVQIIVSTDIRRSAKKRRRILGDFELPRSLEAFTALKSGELTQYIFLPDNATFNSVAHESLHIVHFVLTECKVAFDDELYAYHLGDLSEKVVKFVMEAKTKKGRKS